jgi:hypothetical protein
MNAWDKLGFGLLVALFVTIFGSLAIVIFSNHEHQGYYMKSQTIGAATSYSIMNDIDFAEDTEAYVTDNAEDALKTFERLKATHE